MRKALYQVCVAIECCTKAFYYKVRLYVSCCFHIGDDGDGNDYGKGASFPLRLCDARALLKKKHGSIR